MKKEKLNIMANVGKFKKSRSKKLLAWIKELRLNKRKGKGSLIDKHDGMCCLGVYCHKVEDITKKEMRDAKMPLEIGVKIPFLDQRASSGCSLSTELAESNDDGYSHKQIADWLEENLVKK